MLFPYKRTIEESVGFGIKLYYFRLYAHSGFSSILTLNWWHPGETGLLIFCQHSLFNNGTSWFDGVSAYSEELPRKGIAVKELKLDC
jgi:hypothetical protein